MFGALFVFSAPPFTEEAQFNNSNFDYRIWARLLSFPLASLSKSTSCKTAKGLFVGLGEVLPGPLSLQHLPPVP